MSDLPESLRRAHRAATNRVQTGPANAVTATTARSPYARDRIEAPSNRPAPRTPTLRSRTQDVIRSAPGALTAARERSVYDTTPQDLVRGAQELTGLPSLARGAGALAALPALVRTGSLGTEHLAPGAMAVGETALGLLGPMSLPRSAPRIAAPQIAEETAQRIPNMAREIGPNGMPISQPQPFRNSLRGGSEDLREAAGMAPAQPVAVRPPPAPPATPSLPSGVVMEGRNRGAEGLARYRYTDPNRQGFTYDFVVEPDARSNGIASIQMQPMYNGHRVPMNEIVGEGTAQDAFTVYNALQETLLADARAFNRPGYYITGAGRLRDFHERLAERAFKRGALPEGYQYIPRDRRNSARIVLGERPQLSAPPPTTPTGTAPFGDPRAYPPQAWDDFGSLQGGTPEARGGGAGGGNASVGQSLRGFHGSPRSGLTSVSANPEARQFDNATSQFGAFVSPTRQGAQRYGENVYDVSVDLRRPYEMDLAEFNRFQAPNRGANGEALPGEMWQQRMAELKQEATALRERLAQEGYDGVIVRNRNGEPTEIASFSDIPLGNPPQPLLGGTPEARLRAQKQGFDTGRVLYHGTASAFDEIRPGRRGGQVYLTGDPEIASIYANNAHSRWPGQNNADPNIVPVFARTTNPLVVSDRGPSGEHGWLHDSIADALNLPSSTSARQLRAEVAARGYDSIEARNMLDLGGEQTQHMVFDPRNIRSIFAAFDPAKRDSSDLLAASAAATPIPIAAHALTQQQNTTGRPRGRPGFFGAQR